jgi:hypothetical protein
VKLASTHEPEVDRSDSSETLYKRDLVEKHYHSVYDLRRVVTIHDNKEMSVGRRSIGQVTLLALHADATGGLSVYLVELRVQRPLTLRRINIDTESRERQRNIQKHTHTHTQKKSTL